MKKYIIGLILMLIMVTMTGCCIMVRNTVRPTKVIGSDFHLRYTNGVIVTNGMYRYKQSIYYRTSYVGGPWKGSTIYPGTRWTLNVLSGWSYSSAASGNYMLNAITLPTYPWWIIELPVQMVIDTVFMPYDLLNVPHPPEGYELDNY